MVEHPDLVGALAARVENVSGLEFAGPYQGGRRALFSPKPPSYIRQAKDEGAVRLQHFANRLKQLPALRSATDVPQNSERQQREIERAPILPGQGRQVFNLSLLFDRSRRI